MPLFKQPKMKKVPTVVVVQNQSYPYTSKRGKFNRNKLSRFGEKLGQPTRERGGIFYAEKLFLFK